MQHEPVPPAQMADDRISRYRQAAVAIGDRAAFVAPDQHGRKARQHLGHRGFATHLERERACLERGQPFADADVGVELGEAVRAVVAGRFLEQARLERVGVDAQRCERLVQQAATEFDRLVVAHGLEVVADLGAGLAAAHIR